MVAGWLILLPPPLPNDSRINQMKEKASAISMSYNYANHLIGDTLGEIAREIIPRCNLKRLIVAGGDTSDQVQKHIGIQALQVANRSGIGAPLCYVYSSIPEIDGLEIVFKGGQTGDLNFFKNFKESRTQDYHLAALGNISNRNKHRNY